VPGSRCRILVTGASGLIGSELCGQLVERGHAVIALVHRQHRLLRNNGAMMQPVPYAGTPPEFGTLQWAAGDIRKSNLGLGRKEAIALRNAVELIVHCAAETRFSPESDLHRSVNIDGTANVVCFTRSAHGPAPGLVHLSTAYVSGERSGPIAEEELDVGQTFANGYEATKASAEKLVYVSRLRAAIARPSIVVGTSETGAIGRFENVYGLLRLIGSGRITVLPAAAEASLDLVPIDHVIGGLIDIIERFEAAQGKTFHLVSGDPAPVAALVAFDYSGLHVPRLVSPEQFDLRLLDPGERALYHSVTSAYAAYLRRNPRFSAQNLLALSGRACPPTGPGFLRRVVEYARSAGYLRPHDDTALINSTAT
jgi:2-alkyl-3-oxoalkanoate reductase